MSNSLNSAVRDQFLQRLPSAKLTDDYEQWFTLFSELDAKLFALAENPKTTIAGVNDSAERISAQNTLVAIAAFYAILYHDKKVALVVDGAVGAPANNADLLKDLLGQPLRCDLNDYYWRGQSWQESLNSTVFDNIDVLARYSNDEIAEKANFERMSSLIDDLTQQYDVVLHCGAVLSDFSSTLLVAKLMKNTVLFVRYGSKESDAIAKFINSAESDCQLLGTVMYQFKPPFPAFLFR